ncbi:MAG: hypothetical protein A3K12_16430 [Candidatus Rokubacteria bacterium RIFCSPLOWO2_12_FULL_71_19]|nr:MAG: hypothetical protein A3K12_16430 [Candidatus Rokubacteria bacterium RIFCSPLOWO2_12_FULL_71_19]
MLALLIVLAISPAHAQQQSDPQGPAVPLTVLVNQLVDLFPRLEGEVLEVQGQSATLSAGRKDGARAGLELALFREGREIKHPKTGQVLGRAEQGLGRVTVTEAQEAFSLGTLAESSDVKPGDRFRLSSGKIRLVLLPLLGGVREGLVEAATHELVERLSASGRFQVTMGDAINVFLAQEAIKAEEFLQGKGLREAARRFKVENLLAIHFKRVQSRPFMEVRFFSLPALEPAISTAFFVPPSIRAASSATQFSSSGRDGNRPQAKQRSLLARLLGGDLEAGSYSTGESTIPLREVARFGFPVLAMDVSVGPRDKVPRMVVSDGERVYQYRIVGQRLEADWTFSARAPGRIISIQLVDLDGDGIFEVVGNRFHPKSGVNAFVITVKDGKPRYLAEGIDSFLFAVDGRGEGIKQTLWSQAYSPERLFNAGQASQVVVQNGSLVVEKPVRVPTGFRPMGAAFSNISGKGTRVLAHVDEFNRLQISSEGEDLWRSSTAVGGGYLTIEHVLEDMRGGRSKFYKIEPMPLAVDLDGDGIEELIVPQNLVKEGLLAVVFRGPAGYRLQSIDTGFEGGITGLGAWRADESAQPSLVASVVRFTNIFRTAGETQIIMTIPQD